jgi:DNA-binding transcriptional ArsR family regulator
MSIDASLDHVYAAIADPTRRAMLLLLTQGETTVGALAARFPMSFNGVSKHVKVLERAGLVRRRVAGREHWLRFDPKPLAEASRWLEYYRAFWEDRLASLERLLAAEDRPPPTARKRRGSRRAS